MYTIHYSLGYLPLNTEVIALSSFTGCLDYWLRNHTLLSQDYGCIVQWTYLAQFVKNTPSNVYCTLTIFSWDHHILYDIVWYILYEIQFTMYSVQCTVYTIQCTLYTIHCTVYIIQCTVYSVHYIVYSVHYTVYSIHYTVYRVHYTVYRKCEEYTGISNLHYFIIYNYLRVTWYIISL